ncbi:TSUP family transporter [Lysinibacillus piscis]|uniref:Probable membrane transporter protein n=1 Tax=Lysinibacillus piscis TaxID=2518931 RepID=A0ABQ5NLE5_9BACI|nr:TSUP family transporter [Lysinibacillus sp. KH24]GLC89187.1 UPF0721 transmembrane protein [Lysinibacillus sp. KH24]
MSIDIDILLILIVFGFLAAFVDSVVGGGGLIALPALLFVGLPPSVAVATNKLAGTMGSLTSTITFYRSGQLTIQSVYKLFPLVFFGSMFGAWIVHLMNPNILKPVMLVMLAVVALYTIKKKEWGQQPVKSQHSTIYFLLIITAIGFYDGFLGPGTGSFLLFAFLLVGYDFLQAAGNAKFLNFGSNVAALLLFMYVGQVHYAYGLPMGLAQIAGAIVGSKFAIKRGSGYVRKLFIVVTLLLLLKNGYDYFIS